MSHDTTFKKSSLTWNLGNQPSPQGFALGLEEIPKRRKPFSRCPEELKILTKITEFLSCLSRFQRSELASLLLTLQRMKLKLCSPTNVLRGRQLQVEKQFQDSGQVSSSYSKRTLAWTGVCHVCGKCRTFVNRSREYLGQTENKLGRQSFLNCMSILAQPKYVFEVIEMTL